MLRLASKEQLLTIVEICYNILNDNFELTTREKNRLRPEAAFYRRLSRARSERAAKRIIKQRGEGVPAIIAAIAVPILIELAKEKLFKKPENG